MNAHSLSIVTPTYNRAHLICRSLDMSLQLVAADIASEIIVVDDASTDNTIQMLHDRYSREIASGVLVIERLPVNQGVTGAKNRGAALARGHWIAFMDSDDWFVPESALAMQAQLRQLSSHTAVFFRCQDQASGCLIGDACAAAELTLSTMLNAGTPGECLPVVKRAAILEVPYPTALRGSEGLTYLAWLHAGRTIYLSDLVVREYDNSGADRLSSRKGLKKRAGFLVRHNLHMLRYIRYATPKTVFGWVARIVYYSGVVLINKIYPVK